MEKRNPIVYIIGVEGHFYQAEALKIEFGRPIVAIMTSERMHAVSYTHLTLPTTVSV